MNPTCSIKSAENSPFFQKITTAIEKYGDKAQSVWISITKNAEQYTPKGENKSYTIKWLTWSLLDSEENELFDPPLLVVHPGLTETQIKTDLSKLFPNLKVEVDNEIIFDD